jgi:hypothetical protein
LRDHDKYEWWPDESDCKPADIADFGFDQRVKASELSDNANGITAGNTQPITRYTRSKVGSKSHAQGVAGQGSIELAVRLPQSVGIDAFVSMPGIHQAHPRWLLLIHPPTSQNKPAQTREQQVWRLPTTPRLRFTRSRVIARAASRRSRERTSEATPSTAESIG